MAGHSVTPYDLYGTRSHAKKDKDKELLLASLSDSTSIDLLDIIAANVEGVDSIKSQDRSRAIGCLLAQRDTDVVRMVLASEFKGEREVVHDGDDDQRRAVFEKLPNHLTRFYSLCIVWRPAGEGRGMLLVHSPWGRGGTKSHVLQLLQRACNQEPNSKVKLHAPPRVPQSVLARFLRNANATKITYSRTTGVTSEFDQRSGKKSAPAEMNLVVKGSSSIPFRDALAAAIRRSHDRERFFTVEVADAEGSGRHSETFDDVEIEVETPIGRRTYSVQDNTFPTVGRNLTAEINGVYWSLPSKKYDQWPALLLSGTKRWFDEALEEFR